MAGRAGFNLLSLQLFLFSAEELTSLEFNKVGELSADGTNYFGENRNDQETGSK